MIFKHRVFTFILLALMSPAAHAAEMLPWKSYLFAVMVISIVIAAVLSFRKSKVDSVTGKLLLAGLYFWVMTFAQLIVLAFIYYFSK